MFRGGIFGGNYITRGKNKIKNSMGLFTVGWDFIFGILLYIIILRFRLFTLIITNTVICLQLQRKLNNLGNDLISRL